MQTQTRIPELLRGKAPGGVTGGIAGPQLQDGDLEFSVQFRADRGLGLYRVQFSLGLGLIGLRVQSGVGSA